MQGMRTCLQGGVQPGACRLQGKEVQERSLDACWPITPQLPAHVMRPQQQKPASYSSGAWESEVEPLPGCRLTPPWPFLASACGQTSL